MENRDIIRYIFFAIGVLLVLAGLVGAAGIQAGGVLLGLVVVIAGAIFYRRAE